MYGIWERLLLLSGCCALLAGKSLGVATVVALLAAVTISSLNGYFACPRWCFISLLGYTLLGYVWPLFCIFLPLVCYDAAIMPARLSCIWGIASGVVCLLVLPLPLGLPAAVLLLLAYWLRYQTTILHRQQGELLQLRDSSQELALLQQRQHQDLLEKHDYQIRLATLNERNRIAREIHDHVGHLLSRSILQVGALLVTQPEGKLRQDLAVVRDTLSQALDSIRNSVHDLHADSTDLYMQIRALVEDFSFCPVRLDYRLENEPAREITYCFVAVAKEGLHNIMRHSDATQATLTLLEHPSLYQFVLQDNGTQAVDKADTMSGEGLGLRNMADRVTALGGQLTIEQVGGFRIFISVPKRGR